MDKISKNQGLSFDDVLLIPDLAQVLPRDIDVHTALTKKITINIPIISAAMDTVTESKLAIALAREGGMGIIHKNLSIERQIQEVDTVKRWESGIIANPVTLTPNHTIGEAIAIKEKHHISGFPILENNKLVGILTTRDLRQTKNMDELVGNIMTKKDKLITVPPGTSSIKAKEVLQNYKVEKLPIVDKNGELKGLFTFKDITKKIEYPNACEDKQGRLRVGAAVGVASDMMERLEGLITANLDVLVIDSAHGHSLGVIETVKKIKKKYPEIQLIAGNVATSEGTLALIRAGADAIKVGMGPGSICTTRIVAGAGIPQVTAILECTQVAQSFHVPIIADGGIKYSGDLAKAIGCGADTVMIGNLFAGTEESPGETVLYEGRSFKEYRAMGSLGAMQISRDRYFQEAETQNTKFVPEGVEGRVPHKGPLKDTIYQLIGGLRAGMGYCGVKNVSEMHKKARLIQISSAGLRESHPHDVIITKEPPNYRVL